MTPELLKITDRLDVARPYVWRMRLTADEFDELEAYLYALDAKEKDNQNEQQKATSEVRSRN